MSHPREADTDLPDFQDDDEDSPGIQDDDVDLPDFTVVGYGDVPSLLPIRSLSYLFVPSMVDRKRSF